MAVGGAVVSTPVELKLESNVLWIIKAPAYQIIRLRAILVSYNFTIVSQVIFISLFVFVFLQFH